MKIEIVTENGNLFPFAYEDENVKKGKKISNLNKFYKEIKENVNSIEFKESSMENHSTAIPVCPGKILCPALNFRNHSAETEQKNPEFPYFFPKFSNALIPFNGKILKHVGIEQLDYEGEIAAIIGRKTFMASRKEAQDSIVGFAVVNDVSARDYQNQFSPNLGKNWIMGKSADTFLPVSNTVFIGKEEEFSIKTHVNGEARQDGNTRDMIFPFAEMISYISRNITLEPGDMILSGTPAGVAASGKYPYLKKGDMVRIESDKIGKLENVIA